MTRRRTDQRNASRSSDGSTGWSGPWLVNRSIGVWPVSACWRVLQTCSVQARNRSFSSVKLAMPYASASLKKRSRMKRFSRSCLPRPSGYLANLTSG